MEYLTLAFQAHCITDKEVSATKKDGSVKLEVVTDKKKPNSEKQYFNVKVVIRSASDPHSPHSTEDNIVLLHTFFENIPSANFMIAENNLQMNNQCANNCWHKTLKELGYKVRFYVYTTLTHNYTVKNSQLRSHMQFWKTLDFVWMPIPKDFWVILPIAPTVRLGINMLDLVSDRDKLVLG